MSYNIWLDVKSEKDAKKVGNFLKYNPFDAYKACVWSARGHEWQWLSDFLGFNPISMDQLNDSENWVMKKKIGEFESLVDFSYEILRDERYEKLIQLMLIDEKMADNYFYREINGFDPILDYKENDLEKYNDIENPEIARALREAELMFIYEEKELLEENKINSLTWLSNAINYIDNNKFDTNELLEQLTSDTKFLLGFVLFCDVIATIIKLFGKNYEVTISHG